MILADTSAWIQLFRAGDPGLDTLLDQKLIVMHDFVLGELACGHLRERSRTMQCLATLRRAPTALSDEVLALIEAHNLSGRGLGWIDVNLLASCMLEHVQLYTLDLRLAQAARQLKISL